MRLIDADEAKRIVKSLEKKVPWSTRSVLLLLDAAPTVELPVSKLPYGPLTLDELREMDGEPVWGAFLAGRDCYMIIQWHNCEFFKSYECGFLLAEEYGKTWFAYRRRPEEG